MIQKKSFDSGKSSGFHLAGFHDVVWFWCYVMEISDLDNMCKKVHVSRGQVFAWAKLTKSRTRCVTELLLPWVHPLKTNTFHKHDIFSDP